MFPRVTVTICKFSLCQLSDVIRGEAVVFEWLFAIEGAINVYYSTAPGGKARVYLEPDPFLFFTWNSWSFHIRNPWFERFDECLSRIIESGLIDQWKIRTWYTMKVDAGVTIAKETEESGKLSLEHFLGTFLLYGFMVAIALLCLAAEVVSFYCWKLLKTSGM